MARQPLEESQVSVQVRFNRSRPIIVCVSGGHLRGREAWARCSSAVPSGCVKSGRSPEQARPASEGIGAACAPSIVVVAIPSIRADLRAGYGAAGFVITAYTLTYASLLVTGGRLGDRFGRRRMFITGLLWFTGSSALCGA